jgi:hypothetical protein
MCTLPRCAPRAFVAQKSQNRSMQAFSSFSAGQAMLGVERGGSQALSAAGSSAADPRAVPLGTLRAVSQPLYCPAPRGVAARGAPRHDCELPTPEHQELTSILNVRPRRPSVVHLSPMFPSSAGMSLHAAPVGEGVPVRLRTTNRPHVALATSVPSHSVARVGARHGTPKARADLRHDIRSRRSPTPSSPRSLPKRSSTPSHAPSPFTRRGLARRGSQNAGPADVCRLRWHVRGVAQRNCGLESPFFGVLGCSPPVRSPLLSTSVLLGCSPPVRSQNPIAQDSTFRQGKSRCDATPSRGRNTFVDLLLPPRPRPHPRSYTADARRRP